MRITRQVNRNLMEKHCKMPSSSSSFPNHKIDKKINE